MKGRKHLGRKELLITSSNMRIRASKNLVGGRIKASQRK